jgi:hypothetical protein
MAVTCLLAISTALPVLARAGKPAPLEVTYYYLPG